MQIFKESPVYQAMNITKTVIETDLSASLDGVYQWGCVHKTVTFLFAIFVRFLCHLHLFHNSVNVIVACVSW